MGKVTASSARGITAPAAKVYALLADYVETRPKLLTEHYRDYEVTEGGSGAGTAVRWKLQATSKRVREVAAVVTEPDEHTLVETDTNSSMVTTWIVRADGDSSLVRIESTWTGARGVGGFFEKMFAPGGLRRIYDAVLANLDTLAKES